MPSPDGAQVALTLLSLILASFAVVKVLLPIGRWFGRVGRRISGALDNLGGREAFTDPATGKEIAAIPPIGERLTSIDTRLDALLDVNARLDSHESRLQDHDASIAALIGATFERGANAALSAIEKKHADMIDEETP